MEARNKPGLAFLGDMINVLSTLKEEIKSTPTGIAESQTTVVETKTVLSCIQTLPDGMMRAVVVAMILSVKSNFDDVMSYLQ
ncbi:Hypothetical predicted protein [Paramuricea clavata]|nr:Hypothetical predicted protein [Paramuricea clavata]